MISSMMSSMRSHIAGFDAQSSFIASSASSSTRNLATRPTVLYCTDVTVVPLVHSVHAQHCTTCF